MKKRKTDDYELFYAEIPQSDYLDDIDTAIQDEHQPELYSQDKGLSDQQVSELARDSLDGTTGAQRSEDAELPDQRLFTGDTPEETD